MIKENQDLKINVVRLESEVQIHRNKYEETLLRINDLKDTNQALKT